jgi:hypothetical protein
MATRIVHPRPAKSAAVPTPPAFLAALLLALGGCALVPNSVRPELEHISHATQHFGPDQTSYGGTIVQLTAHWDAPHRFYLEMSEGVALGPYFPGSNSFGGIVGPREEFTARVGYSFEVRR